MNLCATKLTFGRFQRDIKSRDGAQRSFSMKKTFKDHKVNHLMCTFMKKGGED